MPVTRPATLPGWLRYIETLHATPIALGLERVSAVAARMSIDVACPTITVAGTNGKGSTCAMLDSMLRHAGYRTALYTSPHLLRFNERVRIASDRVQSQLGKMSGGVQEKLAGIALVKANDAERRERQRDEQDGADADPPRPPEVAERLAQEKARHAQPSSFTRRPRSSRSVRRASRLTSLA